MPAGAVTPRAMVVTRRSRKLSEYSSQERSCTSPHVIHNQGQRMGMTLTSMDAKFSFLMKPTAAKASQEKRYSSEKPMRFQGGVARGGLKTCQ